MGVVGIGGVGLPATSLPVLSGSVSDACAETPMSDDVECLKTRDETGAQEQRQQATHVTYTHQQVSKQLGGVVVRTSDL